LHVRDGAAVVVVVVVDVDVVVSVVVVGVVGGEQAVVLSGQQSPKFTQAVSHQQPAGALPPQLSTQVGVGGGGVVVVGGGGVGAEVLSSQSYILLISSLSDSVNTDAGANRSQSELSAVMLQLCGCAGEQPWEKKKAL